MEILNAGFGEWVRSVALALPPGGRRSSPVQSSLDFNPCETRGLPGTQSEVILVPGAVQKRLHEGLAPLLGPRAESRGHARRFAHSFSRGRFSGLPFSSAVSSSGGRFRTSQSTRPRKPREGTGTGTGFLYRTASQNMYSKLRVSVMVP